MQKINKTKNNNTSESPALPGEPLSITQFKKWISDAENAPSISLNEAKSIWEKKKKHLGKPTKASCWLL